MDGRSRYELVELIGAGGMAEVYLARMLGAVGFEKQVAIKKLLRHVTADKEFVQRFIDEAQLTARLVHPNICPILDFGLMDECYFIAMEYVDGLDLAALIKGADRENERIPVDVALFIAIGVLRGLKHAHEATDEMGRPLGIVHRDVSPQNVLLSVNGDIKLTDLGAALADQAFRSTRTQKHYRLGKVLYMAPEQRRGNPVDARADLYSTGILLAEMLLGLSEFHQEANMFLAGMCSLSEKLSARLATPLGHALSRVVDRSLVEDPDRRFQTAEEMLTVLEDLLIEYAPGTSVDRVARVVRRMRRARDLRKKRKAHAPDAQERELAGELDDTPLEVMEFDDLPEPFSEMATLARSEELLKNVSIGYADRDDPFDLDEEKTIVNSEAQFIPAITSPQLPSNLVRGDQTIPDTEPIMDAEVSTIPDATPARLRAAPLPTPVSTGPVESEGQPAETRGTVPMDVSFFGEEPDARAAHLARLIPPSGEGPLPSREVVPEPGPPEEERSKPGLRRRSAVVMFLVIVVVLLAGLTFGGLLADRLFPLGATDEQPITPTEKLIQGPPVHRDGSSPRIQPLSGIESSEREARRSGETEIDAPTADSGEGDGDLPAERTDDSSSPRSPRDRSGRRQTVKSSSTEYGYLNINSRPYGIPFVDGSQIAPATPVARHKLPAGKHRVMVRFPHHDAMQQKTVEVVAGATRGVTLVMGEE